MSATPDFTWSDEQEPILAEFAAGRHNLAVVARAGAAKTTTCKEGILRAPEQKKCYTTFNKKNVEEAKEKIRDPKCQVVSMNGLGYRYCLQNWDRCRPDDDVELARIDAAIAANPVFSARKYPPRGVVKDLVAYAKNTCPYAKYQDLLAIAKARGMDVEDYQDQQGWRLEDVAALAHQAMERAKVRDKQNRISFNDQIWLPVVMSWVRPWFDLLVCDEVQDFNATQLIIVRRAVKKAGRTVLVFDPFQAMYEFRGADTAGVDRLVKELNCKVMPLTATFRCPTSVVAQAQVLVPDFRARPGAPAGVVDRLADLDKLPGQVQPGDAVLSRFNAPLVGPCLAVLKTKRRAYIEGRDIGRTLRAVHEKVAARAKDVPQYLEQLDTWAADRIRRVTGDVESDAYKQQIQQVEDQALTLKTLAEDAATPAAVGQLLATLFDETPVGGAPRAVVFSSIHKSKGLEWSHVFLLADTLKRSTWAPACNPEGNILYVAITRAKHHLTWVGPGGPKGPWPAAEQAGEKHVDSQAAKAVG